MDTSVFIAAFGLGMMVGILITLLAVWQLSKEEK